MFTRSYVEVDRDQILISSPPFGKYLIRWDEIDSVETNGLGYVFRGNGKSLSFNTFMGNSKARNVRDKIREEISGRNIAVKQVVFTPASRQKNTKVL